MIDAEKFIERHAPVIMPETDCHVEEATSQQRFLPRGRYASSNARAPHNTAALSDDVLIDGNAYAGDDAPKGSDDLDACREAALRLLDAAARPSGALRDRLLGKGYAQDTVDEVIERLIRVQLIDDEAYAQSAVRYCCGRLMGRRATMMELTRKGVSRTLAERACLQAQESGAFEDAAWELGRRIARKTVGLDPQVRRRRLWSAGGRKGHDSDTMRRIAQCVLEENE